jgi:hypothetical protein
MKIFDALKRRSKKVNYIVDDADKNTLFEETHTKA